MQIQYEIPKEISIRTAAVCSYKDLDKFFTSRRLFDKLWLEFCSHSWVPLSSSNREFQCSPLPKSLLPAKSGGLQLWNLVPARGEKGR